jgi:penicillin-binding protein 2
MNDILSNPEEVKTLLPRYRYFYTVLILMFLIFSFRLWFLQIYQGSTLRQFSERNHLKEIKVEAPRGLILDREGRALVDNRLGYEVYFQSQYIKDWTKTIESIAPLISIPADKLEQKVSRARKQQGRYAPIRIKENLSLDEVFRLKRARLTIPGLDIRDKVLRNYNLGKNGSQAFGYVGEISKKQLPLLKKLYPSINFEQGDIVGKFGIEELLEEHLHGQNGIKLTQVDAFGREISNPNEQTSKEAQQLFGNYIKDKAAVPGHNVMMTLDADIQQAAWDAFQEEKKIGGAVVMKSNGEILAWISAPGFDPNDFLGGISTETWLKLVNDPFKPLRNKVIQDHFAPGSTFKPLVALAGLQEKAIRPNSYVFCPGALSFGNRFFHDHLKGGFGNIALLEALERSSNVYFYKLGINLGVDKMHKYISAMGVGSKTGIELPREAPGLMPSSEWKKKARNEDWHPGENLSVAIGQGFVQATPLQMAMAYLAVGSEGLVVKPHLVKKILSPQGHTVKEVQPQIIRKLSEGGEDSPPLIDKAHFEPVKEGLRLVVNGARGTARSRVKLDGVEIAGKTGTAQVRGFSATEIFAKCENRPIHMRHHGWFVGYAPAKDPEIVVAVLAEHSCSGSGGAGPLARSIFHKYFQKYHPHLNVQIPKILPAASSLESGNLSNSPSSRFNQRQGVVTPSQSHENSSSNSHNSNAVSIPEVLED